jgi:uncharacterized tellurite resistance protein B-like protein
MVSGVPEADAERQEKERQVLMPPVNELFKLPAQALADVYLVYREPGAEFRLRFKPAIR